jgi:hypothetical protein
MLARYLDLGLVLDIDCRIAGEPRSQEQGDIVLGVSAADIRLKDARE